MRFIFTVTNGRTGTGYLASLLGMLCDIYSVHEPKPGLFKNLRGIQSDPNIAERFLLEQKLPAILNAATKPIYAETNNGFCKGYLETWLSIDGLPIPDLILLQRSARSVALSMSKLGTIPGRSDSGLQHYLSPGDSTCLTRLKGWESLEDYQLCFWHCLEIEHRQVVYGDLVTKLGGRVASTSAETLGTWAGFSRLRRQLELPGFHIKGLAKYLAARKRPVNRKSEEKHISVNEAENRLKELEAATRDRISIANGN